MIERVAERYLRLGLRIGRHVDGMVDAYFGPPELSAAVDAEPLSDPAGLVAEADALLGEHEDGWVRDQVAALRTYAGVLAGESPAYTDEVEGCYGVRPAHTDEAVFEAAHAELDHLLPGDGPVSERYDRWRTSTLVPAGQIERTIAAVIAEARGWTRRLVDLPEGEDVDLEIVHDKRWMGFCEYVGGLRSKISVNADLPMSAMELLILAIHETYPGHHAERCSKDALLVRGRGRLEEAIVLVPTPQSLVSEGIASIAPRLVLEGDAGPGLAAVIADAGIAFNLDHTLAVERAAEPCGWAQVNAALMRHADGADKADVHAYLRRYGLMDAQIADHVVRFIDEPTARTYILTYSAGRDLCRAYVAAEPDGFRRLLTEQVRVGDLVRAGSGPRSGAAPGA